MEISLGSQQAIPLIQPIIVTHLLLVCLLVRRMMDVQLSYLNPQTPIVPNQPVSMSVSQLLIN